VDHTRWFGYDGQQMLVQFDREGGGRLTAQDQSYRYLWGPAVDQILADEQLFPLATDEGTSASFPLPPGEGQGEGPAHGGGYDLRAPGRVLWPLADHLGTVRDLAQYDAASGTTTVVEHRVYDSFGNLVAAIDPATNQAAAVDFLFGFTARPLDSATGLQNNVNRWYDAAVGRWLSPDPLGLAAGDANLYRYVGNSPIERKDPNGLSPWVGIARILGKRWGAKTCERAAKALAAELLEKLKNYRPDHPKAQEIIRELKKMGWVEERLGHGTHEGQGLILREVVNGRKTDVMLEWHPGGGHHGPDHYWKFSSGKTGTLRTVGGIVAGIVVAVVPGAAQAAEGELNAAARDVVVESTFFRWSKWGAELLGTFTDWLETDLYGEEYHQKMEAYRKEFWQNKGTR